MAEYQCLNLTLVGSKNEDMELNNLDIIELIKKGESEQIEFKSKIPNSTILARTLASFANTKGGVLLIGVADNGKILGLTEQEILQGEKIIRNITNSLFDYDVPYETIRINGKEIIIVQIDKVKNDSFPIISSSGDMFIRVGSQMQSAQKFATKSAIAQIMSRNMSHNIGTQILKDQVKKETNEKIIFVAMSFREEEEPALVDYYKAMERSATKTKLPIKVSRMDKIEGDYEISQQIMEEIDKSDIVIADFTLSSQNVYFELGYARAKNKRIIQTSRKGTKLEFDTRNWKTIIYRNATELEAQLESAIEVAYKELIK